MRGYVQQLNDQLSQPGLVGGLAMGAGAVAGGLGAWQQQEAERKRKQSQEQLGILQKLGAIAVENKDGAMSAGLANQMPGLLKQGYGIDVPNRQLVGEPVMARGMDRPFIDQQGPSQVPGQKVGVLGAMSPTPYEYDTGERNLNNPRTLDQARKGLMLAAPAPSYEQWDPYKDVVETRTGRVVRAATPRPTKTAEADPLLTLKSKKLEAEIARLNRPEKQPVDRTAREATKAVTDWQMNRARYVADYVSLKMRNNRRIVQSPMGPQSVEVPVDAKTEEQWRKAAEAEFDRLVPMPPPPGGVGRADPFANPGGAQAAPAGNPARPIKAQRSRIPVPTKYEDVALLPEFEAHAQEALKLAPGTSISSRARSEKRNAAAGGAADSWHKHRQAFDLVGAKPAQKAALKAWAAQRGLWMLDEGDHLHFQPIQGVSAETAPKMAAFYERHGITPGEANA